VIRDDDRRHFMEEDEFGLECDIDAARQLETTVENAELFLYPGNRHVFTDSSVPDHDEDATMLVKQCVLAFLDRVA
jgi:dienelactone hydrolase